MVIASSHVQIWPSCPGFAIKYDIGQFDMNALYLVKEVLYSLLLRSLFPEIFIKTQEWHWKLSNVFLTSSQIIIWLILLLFIKLMNYINRSPGIKLLLHSWVCCVLLVNKLLDLICSQVKRKAGLFFHFQSTKLVFLRDMQNHKINWSAFIILAYITWENYFSCKKNFKLAQEIFCTWSFVGENSDSFSCFTHNYWLIKDFYFILHKFYYSNLFLHKWPLHWDFQIDLHRIIHNSYWFFLVKFSVVFVRPLVIWCSYFSKIQFLDLLLNPYANVKV